MLSVITVSRHLAHGSAPAMFISEHDLDMLYYKQLQNVFKDMHIQGRYALNVWKIQYTTGSRAVFLGTMNYYW